MPEEPAGADAGRAYLLYMLPALAVVTPLVALLGLLLGVGPAPGLRRVCMIFLVIAPATGLLGLRTLARVGSTASPAVHRTARTWCYLALATGAILYLGLEWLGAA